jgi:hypothetical protein
MAERLENTNRNAGIDFVNLSRLKLKIDPRVLTRATRATRSSGATG